MKKVLSVLGLIAILSMTSPAMAAPHGHGGPGGHGPHHGGHRIHAGAHHRPHMAPRHHHGGGMVYVGHHPRHSHWHGYRTGYWGSPWCNYRLGLCDPYLYPPCRPHAGIHFPVGGAGVSIRF